MYLHNWLIKLLGMYSHYTWIFHGVIVLVIASALYCLQRKLVKRLLVRFQKTSRVWDDALLQALSLPLSIFVWICAAAIFAEYILLDFGYADWSKVIVKMRAGCCAFLFVWFLWRGIAQIEKRLFHLEAAKSPLDVTTVSIVGRCARIGLVIIGVLILLQSLGIPLSGVIAFGGGGAIVMGIAAQQLLANWFGGLMIFLDKPFKLGDWIQSPDKIIEGVVTRIGWRTTEVMSLEHRPLYIPNALFNQIVIVNPQRMVHRRIDVTVGIRYDDAPVAKDIVRAIDAMIHRHPNVDPRENRLVHLVGFGPSTLNINVYCFSKTTQNPHWRNVQQDILFKIMDIVAEYGAEFAFPTVTTNVSTAISNRGEPKL